MSMSKHPCIATFYTSFVVDTDVWIVMPIYEGGSISDLLQIKYKEGITDECIIAAVIRNVIQALQYLHKQNQVHRDIKCGNILLDMQGNFILADFGICDVIPKKFSKEGIFLGTPCWMAPEMLTEGRQYDCKSDIWSLAITAVELAEGKAPYSDLSPAKVLLELFKAMKIIIEADPPRLKNESKWSKPFKEFIYDCLVKTSALRPSSFEILEKHSKFFSKAYSTEKLRKILLADLPILEDRVNYILNIDKLQIVM